MEKFEGIWYATIIIAVIATIIVITYAILIHKSIKKYNVHSLNAMKQYQDLKNMQEKMLLESEIEVREHTFQYISKEIHDNITQSLSLANLTLNCIVINDPPEIKNQLDKCRIQIRKALNDLNSLSKSLDSEIIESHGLTQAIEFELERWKRMFDIEFNFTVSGKLVHLEIDKELILFRIIQESINNAIKHAQANTIDILLDYQEKRLNVIVRDNGSGFDLTEIERNKVIGKMAGLKNMRQRAEIINGSLEVMTKLKKGTSIILNTPI